MRVDGYERDRFVELGLASARGAGAGVCRTTAGTGVRLGAVENGCRHGPRRRWRGPRGRRGPDCGRPGAVRRDGCGRAVPLRGGEPGDLPGVSLDARLSGRRAHGHGGCHRHRGRRRPRGRPCVHEPDGHRHQRARYRQPAAGVRRRPAGAGQLDPAGAAAAAGHQLRDGRAPERLWRPGGPVVRRLRAVHDSRLQRSRPGQLQRGPARRPAHGREPVQRADQQHREHRGAQGAELGPVRPGRRWGRHQAGPEAGAGRARLRPQLPRGALQHAPAGRWRHRRRGREREGLVPGGLQRRAQ